jgi:hypothetical protein
MQRITHYNSNSGDVIAIMYNNKVYEMSVLETKPAAAVSVIECDLNVDFAPPVGYKEPEFKKKVDEEEDQVTFQKACFAICIIVISNWL